MANIFDRVFGALFGKLETEPDLVKQVFDHFRNIGIAALVFSGTRWTDAEAMNRDGFFQFTAVINSTFLYTTSITLFILNYRHGLIQLDKHFSKHSRPGVTVRIFYAMFAYALFTALTVGVASAGR